MKKNYLFMLLLLLSACHGGAIIDSEAPIDGASQTDLTEPPAGLAARKPLAIPPKEKIITPMPKINIQPIIKIKDIISIQFYS